MNGASVGVGRLSTAPVEEGMESMCRLTDCGHPEVVVGIALLCLTGAFLLVGGAVLVRLSDAREEVSAERSRTHAERDAFTRFKRRVARIDPDTPSPPDPPSAGGGMLAAAGTASDGASLADARTAYAETVMSTPHYETEYDETLAESLSAEFGDGVAGAMVGDGGTLTPQLRATLVGSADRACDEREELLADLDREEAAIDAAEDTLAPAATAAEEVREADLDGRSYRDLVADYERLEWHEERVEALLRDRQSTVHDRESDRPHWFEYLYGRLSSPYPIVGAATGALSDLAAARDGIASAASRR